jgi:N-acetylglucosaminyldiphosphoundecaprenol N-acetyl-beta-D-mannosaminyltransferase
MTEQAMFVPCTSVVHAADIAERVKNFSLFGVPISRLNFQDTIAQVMNWAEQRERTRLVTFSNVHMLTEGHKKPWFRAIHTAMDMNCPDGAPLVWLGRTMAEGVERVSGPDFMRHFCKQTAQSGLRHFFYGGGDGTAECVIEKLRQDCPGIQIAGSYTPPFGQITSSEDDEAVLQINNSQADILWVCLGCPKQEIWMYEHRDRLRVGVVLAVGQAFDITAGRVPRAPAIMQNNGLEWLYRLSCEPGRLGRRYLSSNTMFLWLIFRSLLHADRLQT